MLWNTKPWYNIKEKDLKELEKLDRMLLKIILAIPSSTPTPLLYLELGLVSLMYIIQGRRLTFLRYILTSKNYDLLLNFFNAQTREPSKNDWTFTVQKDLLDFDIKKTFNDIKSFSKNYWHTKVKKAIRSKAFEDLLDVQLNLSKGENLVYVNLQMSDYFQSNQIITK